MTTFPKRRSDDWAEEFDRRYRASLRAYFRRRLSNDAEADELAQEVLAKLVERGQIDAESAPAYIFTVAANLLRDHYRRQAVRDAWIDEIVALQPDGEVEWRDPERVLAGRQALGRAREVLESLPERTRNIFLLYRIEGLPRQDIADAFVISVSAVEKHIATAMKALMNAQRTQS